MAEHHSVPAVTGGGPVTMPARPRDRLPLHERIPVLNLGRFSQPDQQRARAQSEKRRGRAQHHDIADALEAQEQGRSE
jgi:hypothetical protein